MRVRIPLCALAILAGFTLVACSPDSAEPADVVDTEPALELGGSDDHGSSWVDWSGGAVDADMHAGPQGCCHVWVSMRSPDLQPGKVKVSMEMFLVDTGVRVLRGKLNVTAQFKADPGPAHLYGVPGFIDCPCTVDGRAVRVEASATDSAGLTLSGKAEFTPRAKGVHCTGEQAPGEMCIICPAYDVGQMNSHVPCTEQ